MQASFLQEQKGLCAFCCNSIGNSPTRIAHVVPRAFNTVSPTAWSNMVLSCNSESLPDPSCDVKQGNSLLPVSPLMPDAETLFEYNWSGKMTGKNSHAQNTIRLLNLDAANDDDRDHRLRKARREAIVAMAIQKRKVRPKTWANMLAGNLSPLPAFQPAIAFLMP